MTNKKKKLLKYYSELKRITKNNKGKLQWETGKKLIRRISNKKGVINSGCAYELLMGYKDNNSKTKNYSSPDRYIIEPYKIHL